MTARLIAVAIGLTTSFAIWHVQATSPRQLADTAEHALGWVCRMTYKGGDATCSTKTSTALPTAGTATARPVLSAAVESNAAPTFKPKAAAVTYFLRMLGLPRL